MYEMATACPGRYTNAGRRRDRLLAEAFNMPAMNLAYEDLMKKLFERGYSFIAITERLLVRGLKGKMCYTALLRGTPGVQGCRNASGVAEAGPLDSEDTERLSRFHRHNFFGVPVVLSRQIATLLVLKTVEVPLICFFVRRVDVPVVLQRQVPKFQEVQKFVEFPQVQVRFVD